MQTVKMECSWYDGLQEICVEIMTYDSTRKERWQMVESYAWGIGDKVGLGEAATVWETLCDALIQSHGLQLLLPFE